MDEIDNIKYKEENARREYSKTRDPKYLQIVIDCMNQREKLLYSRIPDEANFMTIAE